MWDAIAQEIRKATGQPFTLHDQRAVSGGCINQASVLSSVEGPAYFVKINTPDQIEMFAAEALALKQMRAAEAIRVPEPICYGATDRNAFIVMEYLPLGGGSPQAWREMGRQLARLHQTAMSSQGFGWDRNNTIGDTPQLNPWTSDWAAFFTESRLGYQFKLARRNGGYFAAADALLNHVPILLADHHPQPSLVHGDLWSGNASITREGEPVILDPAAYYGDREVDIAMTELFGGFPATFYQGYAEVWPLNAGYQQRKTLYNLYHILNHYNLFGSGYAGQAERMMRSLLAQSL